MEFFTQHYYDIYLSLFLSVIGIVYSILSFREAKAAKKAAEKAGIIVKTQETFIELERISRICEFWEDIKYSEATGKLNEIGCRIHEICGMYKWDSNIQVDIQTILGYYEGAKMAVESANPSNPESVINDDSLDEKYKQNFIFNQTAPHLSQLINSLYTLKGVLSSRLIYKTN